MCVTTRLTGWYKNSVERHRIFHTGRLEVGRVGRCFYYVKFIYDSDVFLWKFLYHPSLVSLIYAVVTHINLS